MNNAWTIPSSDILFPPNTRLGLVSELGCLKKEEITFEVAKVLFRWLSVIRHWQVPRNFPVKHCQNYRLAIRCSYLIELQVKNLPMSITVFRFAELRGTNKPPEA